MVYGELCPKFTENPTLQKVDFDTEINSKCLMTLDEAISNEGKDVPVEGKSWRSLQRYKICIKWENLLTVLSEKLTACLFKRV